MNKFQQQLTDLGLSSEQVEAVCNLVVEEIIGAYQKSPIPDFTSAREIAQFETLSDLEASRNGLRLEQRAKVGKEWALRNVDMMTLVEEG